jgi:hypothetical protein
MRSQPRSDTSTDATWERRPDMRTHRLSTCITIAGVMLTLLVGVLSGNPAA